MVLSDSYIEIFETYKFIFYRKNAENLVLKDRYGFSHTLSVLYVNIACVCTLGAFRKVICNSGLQISVAILSAICLLVYLFACFVLY